MAINSTIIPTSSLSKSIFNSFDISYQVSSRARVTRKGKIGSVLVSQLVIREPFCSMGVWSMVLHHGGVLRFAAAPGLKLSYMVANRGISSPLSTLIAT